MSNGIMSNKQKVKQYYDRTAKHLEPLAVGDTVRIKLNNKLWKPAAIVKQHDYRSYTAKTKDDNVLYRRNRRHFLKIK